MRWTLLGCDEGALHVARALLTLPGNEFVAAADVGAYASRLPGAPRRVEIPEQLVGMPRIDWTLVAPLTDPNDSDARENLLRLMVQAEMPLIVMLPTCRAILAYELELARVDSRSPIVPLSCEVLHPGLQELRRLLHASATPEMPSWEQLTVERTVSSAASRTSAPVWLARDIAVIRMLVGEQRAINAVGRAGAGDWPELLSATLSGPPGIVTNWSIRFGDEPTGLRCTAVGERGRIALDAPDSGNWTVRENAGGARQFGFSPVEFGRAINSRLEVAAAGQPLACDWPQACHDLELAESAAASIRRRRTIEVIHEAPTEQDAFKAVMSSVGCALLMVILLVLLVWGVIAGIELAQHRVADAIPGPEAGVAREGRSLWLRLWPVYPLAAFLLLQFLVYLAKGRSARHDVAG